MFKLLSGTVLLVIVVVFCVWLFGMKSISVNPGEEIVLIDRPFLFGSSGVQAEPLKQGRKFIFYTTETYPVVVTPLSKTIKFDDLASNGSELLDFDSNVQYRVVDSNSLIVNFGPDWFKNNIESQYRTIVRDAVKKKTMAQIMSDTVSAEEIDIEVTEKLEQLVKDNNIPIKIINISLGQAKPNEDVQRQINLTAAENQRAKTIESSTQAESKRKLNEATRAEADSEYRNKMNMNVEQFVTLQTTKMMADACAKSQSCIVTSGQPVVVPVK